MKAILVLDEMPNKCNECPFHKLVDKEHFIYDNRLICFPYDVIHKKIKTTEWDADRPQWCPLKEIEK